MEERKCFRGVSERDWTLAWRVEGREQVYKERDNR